MDWSEFYERYEKYSGIGLWHELKILDSLGPADEVAEVIDALRQSANDLMRRAVSAGVRFSLADLSMIVAGGDFDTVHQAVESLIERDLSGESGEELGELVCALHRVDMSISDALLRRTVEVGVRLDPCSLQEVVKRNNPGLAMQAVSLLVEGGLPRDDGYELGKLIIALHPSDMRMSNALLRQAVVEGARLDLYNMEDILKNNDLKLALAATKAILDSGIREDEYDVLPEVACLLGRLDRSMSRRLLEWALNAEVPITAAYFTDLLRSADPELSERVVRRWMDKNELREDSWALAELLHALQDSRRPLAKELLQWAVDEKIAFDACDLAEFVKDSPPKLTEAILLNSIDLLCEEDMETLLECGVSRGTIRKVCKRMGITPPWEQQVEGDGIGLLEGILEILSAGSESGGSGGNGSGCNGDCANCPPHYGYRYGRWYYGHGHVHGCEFGGNKGDGS